MLALLQKIRDSHGMLRFLQSKNHKVFLRFNKNRTISLSESERERPEPEKDKIDKLSEESSDNENIGFKSNEEMLVFRENFRKLIV